MLIVQGFLSHVRRPQQRNTPTCGVFKGGTAMSYVITVSRDGEVFVETQPVKANELAGLLEIIEKPSMFGSPGFQVTIQRV